MKNVRRKWKKFSALALAVVFMGTSTNLTAFAAENCEHHTHNDVCGYVEAVEGADCTHEHGDECCSKVEVCVHEHDENCGDAEGSCTHTCSVESRCITTKENCNHSHDENCGYVQAVEGSPCTYACEECAAEVSNEEEEEAVTCTCGTDDPAIHATNCLAYVAPENPVCICAMKCSEDTLNVWCDICGEQGVSACQGNDVAVVYDETPVTSGNCGATANDNVTWNFDSATGTLTISGTGAMKDMSFDDDGEDQPWYDYRATITKIVIGDGITQIGALAFYACSNVEEVVFERNEKGESSVTAIGNSVFFECMELKEILIPASVETIGDYAFKTCIAMESIEFEEGSNLTTIGNQAFYGAVILEECIIPSKVTTITIGDHAFRAETSLKRFYYPSGISFDSNTTVFIYDSALQYFGCYTVNETDKTCSISYIGVGQNGNIYYPDENANEQLSATEIVIPEKIDGYEVVGVKIGDTTISVPSDFETEHTVERLSDITALDGWTYEAETDTLSPGSSIDVTAIYSVSGTPKLIKEITISRSACADANNDHVCDYGCGRTIGSADDGNDNNTSEETEELKETEEQIFTRELLTKVAGAKAGDNVVIDATIWHSFSAKVLEQLFAKEGVSYTIYYYYKGEYFYITIPANAALEEGIDWYGPLKLNAMFGRTMITKAEYEEAIAKIRKIKQ